MTTSKNVAQNKGRKSADTSANAGDFSDDTLSEKIGKSLRSMYDDVASEPVPDAFLELLAEAESKQSSK